MIMKYTVGIGDMQVSRARGDVLVTHALGSCLGIAAHDAASCIGALLHVMLPTSTLNPAKAEANPFMFVDTGVPALLGSLMAAGASRSRLKIAVAGGAKTHEQNEDGSIGERNYIMLRKVLWPYGLLIESESIGGLLPKTMYLEVGSGQVWLTVNGDKMIL